MPRTPLHAAVQEHTAPAPSHFVVGNCKWRAQLARPRICGEEGSSRAVFCCNPNTIEIHHVRYSPVLNDFYVDFYVTALALGDSRLTLKKCVASGRRRQSLQLPRQLPDYSKCLDQTPEGITCPRLAECGATFTLFCMQERLFPFDSKRRTNEQFSSPPRGGCSSRSSHHSSPAPTPLTRRLAL